MRNDGTWPRWSIVVLVSGSEWYGREKRGKNIHDPTPCTFSEHSSRYPQRQFRTTKRVAVVDRAEISRNLRFQPSTDKKLQSVYCDAVLYLLQEGFNPSDTPHNICLICEVVLAVEDQNFFVTTVDRM